MLSLYSQLALTRALQNTGVHCDLPQGSDGHEVSHLAPIGSFLAQLIGRRWVGGSPSQTYSMGSLLLDMCNKSNIASGMSDFLLMASSILQQKIPLQHTDAEYEVKCLIII